MAGRHDQQKHAGRSASMSFESMPIDERRAAWSKLPKEKRDGIAKASTAIKSIISERLSFAGQRPTSGTPEECADKRLKSIGGFVMPDAHAGIKKASTELASILRETGAREDFIRETVLDTVDALAVQENEALRRTLGDHGVRHIMGDIYMALDILKEVPGYDTPQDKAATFIAGIYHDTGYLTKPSQIFLDEDHPSWSRQHFDANAKSRVAANLGKDTADLVSNIVNTHYTADLDWQNDAAASAFRVADNAALFKNEKMPGLLHYVPDNFSVIKDFADKKIDMDVARQRLAKNIGAQGNLTPEVRTALLDSVDEFSPFLVKSSLGMLAGKVENFAWKDGALLVELKRDPATDKIQQVLDVGQRQFKKFAESLGVDPDDFSTQRSLELKDNNKVVLRAVIKSKIF